jgi:hypothetical protein
MTPEMAFECLLVSPDPAVLGTMNRVLRDFSITSSPCPNAASAAELLDDHRADLMVLDLQADNFSGLLQHVQENRAWQKPTVLALSEADCSMPGIDVFLRKPVTIESGVRSLKTAYQRMVRDYRKHTRFALMTPVIAIDENLGTLQATVTNIGEGGVGLSCTQKLPIGNILTFSLRLPELENRISVRVRVLWNRQYGAGCEFVRIEPFDLHLLHAWLESRYRIKKPLIAI